MSWHFLPPISPYLLTRLSCVGVMPVLGRLLSVWRWHVVVMSRPAGFSGKTSRSADEDAGIVRDAARDTVPLPAGRWLATYRRETGLARAKPLPSTDRSPRQATDNLAIAALGVRDVSCNGQPVRLTGAKFKRDTLVTASCREASWQVPYSRAKNEHRWSRAAPMTDWQID